MILMSEIATSIGAGAAELDPTATPRTALLSSATLECTVAAHSHISEDLIHAEGEHVRITVSMAPGQIGNATDI